MASKEKQEFQGLAFLYVLFLWAMGLLGVYLLLGSVGYHNFGLLDRGVPALRTTIKELFSLFRYSDAWNYLLLTLLVCLAILLYGLNDFWLRRVGQRHIFKSWTSTHTGRGLLWSARQICNGLVSVIQMLLLTYMANLFVANPYILAVNQVGGEPKATLVLGTSKLIRGTSNPNLYYQKRLECAIQLYRAGQVKYFLLSGDRQQQDNYDETADMRNDLVSSGIPEKSIRVDPHGHRTFDSIIRTLQSSTGRDTVMIVSQTFHLERALYLCRQVGLPAVGVVAGGAPTGAMIQREFLAKLRVLLDVYIFNTPAYGVSRQDRRTINPTRVMDLVLILFVAGFVVLAGRVTRGVLHF